VSTAPIAVALLPGPGDADATRASVRAEAGADVPVVTLAEGKAAELLGMAETIAFARAGDRWSTGTLAARLRPLAAHPTAALAVAAHVLVDVDGRAVLTVPPPPLPLDPVELLLRARVEPAAVLVRADALDATALELLLRPHGEVVVWSRLARAGGLVRSSEVAAEIPLDAERHGAHRGTRTAALLAAASDPAATPDALGASTVRRELLRQLYLDAGPDPQPADLIDLVGGAGEAGAEATAVIADLQWALERARDALADERAPWPESPERDEDAPGQYVEEELFDLRAAVRTMGSDVEVRDALLRRYEAEILRRDAIISRLTGGPLGAEAVADAEYDGEPEQIA
jgi:hypothetical protein